MVLIPEFIKRDNRYDLRISLGCSLYALLYEALQKRREDAASNSLEYNTANHVSESLQYSDHDILDYLDDLRKMGIKAVFPKNVE